MRLTAIFATGCCLVAADAPAQERTFAFERVDVLSQDSGAWVNYELPTLGSYPLRPLFRFLEQVKVVFALPVQGLDAGLSIASQSLSYERRIPGVPSLSWNVGVNTRALLPRGAFAGVAWRGGPVRIGIGVSALSEAAWANPSWRDWTVLPTLGLGFGPAPRPR